MPGAPLPGHFTPPADPDPGGSVLDWLPGYSALQSTKVFVGELSDWHMWASLGWLALGLLLIGLGLALWMRLPQVAARAAAAGARALI